MISWINKEYKNHYNDSAKASGIRYAFYTYENDFDKSTVEDIKKFIAFLRKEYYFPIRLNILFCNTSGFRHNDDNHKYYGAFYDMEDSNKLIYPRISIAAKVSENHSIESVLLTLAHEITHYYQWFFLEEDKRSDRSLEAEANKWSEYIVDTFFNDHLIN